MDADDAIDILEGLDKKKADEIIDLIEPEQKNDIQLIKSYKDNEFGSLMTTNYITLEHGIGIKNSINQLIEEAEENDNIETLYIVKDGKFYGALTLRDLLITKKDEDLEAKIILSYPFVYDREEITDAAIDTLADYSEDSIPVLNKDNEIMGVITAGDIVEFIHEDEEEEIIEKKQEGRKVNYLGLAAFILILLVAVNRVFNIVPMTTYVEVGLIIIAIVLEAYDHLKLNKA